DGGGAGFEVEVSRALRPGGAPEDSPRRQPWGPAVGKMVLAPEGRKILPPLRGSDSPPGHRIPTASAVGYLLAPLRGYEAILLRRDRKRRLHVRAVLVPQPARPHP